VPVSARQVGAQGMQQWVAPEQTGERSFEPAGDCLGLFDTCPCDATVPRVAQT
jgi:hypothetical protein